MTLLQACALFVAAALGGALNSVAAGALVLINTPQATFLRHLPYLLLTTTLIFAFGGQITARLRRAAPVAPKVPDGHPGPPAGDAHRASRVPLVALSVLPGGVRG